jgi:FKBP-type peptidyl-prolyl cis-trans isomerase SlyD
MIDYTLTGDDGRVIDSSDGGEPLGYVHGVGSIVPGLEKALEGKSAGESVQVKVSPGEGYGEHDPELVRVATREQFQGIPKVEVGMQFRAGSGEESMVVTVASIDGDQITLDGNHPLAGMNLNFAVKVVEVRAATKVEIEHGHPHGPDDHHH